MWTYSMQPAKNIHEPMNLKPTHVLNVPTPSWDMTSTLEPYPVEERLLDDVSIINPVPSREELIVNIYSPLQSACGKKFISTAGITDYIFSERVKCHRLLPMKILVMAKTPKCLGSPTGDRDRLNDRLCIKSNRLLNNHNHTKNKTLQKHENTA
ncbi:hypothetical protein TNCV_4995741 [Trichonephila clavipes]|nr:hypothetical protein TNCV_4995741 [Trichonephila clavipes]